MGDQHLRITSQNIKRGPIIALIVLGAVAVLSAAAACANAPDATEGPAETEGSPVLAVGSLDEAEAVMGFPIMTLPADALPAGSRLDTIQVKTPMEDAVTQVWSGASDGSGFVMLAQAPRPLGLAGGTPLSATGLGENVHSRISPAQDGREFAIGSLAWRDQGMSYMLTMAIEPGATIDEVVRVADRFRSRSGSRASFDPPWLGSGPGNEPAGCGRQQPVSRFR